MDLGSLPRPRSVMMAAVVLGSALAAPDAAAASPRDPIRDISRYCSACWRNARLPADHWQDCTQQVLVRLLERLSPEQWGNVLAADGDERREFIRAIDAVKKRTQRARKFADLATDVPAATAADELADERDAVARAAAAVLSDRQRKIVEMTGGGLAVPEIAVELAMTPERVSDEKYKAIRKLRAALGVA